MRRRVFPLKGLDTGIYVVLLFMLLSSFSGLCSAQDSAETEERSDSQEESGAKKAGSSAEEPDTGLEVVPLSEVVQRSEKLMTLIGETLKKALENSQISAIEEELPRVSDTFYNNAAESTQIIYSKPTHSQLVDLKHRWDINLEELGKKRKILSEHIKVIEEDLESLKNLKAG